MSMGKGKSSHSAHRMVEGRGAERKTGRRPEGLRWFAGTGDFVGQKTELLRGKIVPRGGALAFYYAVRMEKGLCGYNGDTMRGLFRKD